MDKIKHKVGDVVAMVEEEKRITKFLIDMKIASLFLGYPGSTQEINNSNVKIRIGG